MTGSGSSMFLDDARSLADVIATGTDEQQRMQFALDGPPHRPARTAVQLL
ncbi:hypothetical protein OG887_00550 [Streptomyces sp. NBC_00053]|nr:MULTISPECIES: hypothetical protein [unclassified Streptomyces]WSG55553.1 hypothetical protein OHA38_40585 [Streptomyces sp. NBC_01732]WSX06692.1 hypothetical protein OG355_43460 [Streptomyces sp. NBC_00987]MCX4391456.1 hypothetical protein [Streptomyces sp. NBC_01767]MCX5098083.1 hypothetical protein [Streptomyces sp. NBC_00439]MCX5165401.1 hypothetical protein [Streptomyces sp. NBC_00305]